MFLWHFRNCCVAGANHIVQVGDKNGNKIILCISLFLFKLGMVKNRHPVGAVTELLISHTHTRVREYICANCPDRGFLWFSSFTTVRFQHITTDYEHFFLYDLPLYHHSSILTALVNKL